MISFVDISSTDGVFRISLEWELTWIKRNKSWYLFKSKTPKNYLPFKRKK